MMLEVATLCIVLDEIFYFVLFYCKHCTLYIAAHRTEWHFFSFVAKYRWYSLAAIAEPAVAERKLTMSFHNASATCNSYHQDRKSS